MMSGRQKRAQQLHRESLDFARTIRKMADTGVVQAKGAYMLEDGSCCAQGAYVRAHVGGLLSTESIHSFLREHVEQIFSLDPGPCAAQVTGSAVVYMNDSLELSFHEIADFFEATPLWAWEEALRIEGETQ